MLNSVKCLYISAEDKLYKRPVGYAAIKEREDELVAFPSEFADQTPIYMPGTTFVIYQEKCYAFYKEFSDVDTNTKIYIFVESELTCDKIKKTEP